ncbi:CML12 [Symbiodinium sp. CCMP2456]|nr:CML12 [Symbiodinium sp. CCMP2456]
MDLKMSINSLEESLKAASCDVKTTAASAFPSLSQELPCLKSQGSIVTTPADSEFHLFGPGFTADAFRVAEEMAGQPLPADLLSPPDLAEVGPHDVQNPADLVQLSDSQQCAVFPALCFMASRIFGCQARESLLIVSQAVSELSFEEHAELPLVFALLHLRLNQQRLLTSTGPIVAHRFQLIAILTLTWCKQKLSCVMLRRAPSLFFPSGSRAAITADGSFMASRACRSLQLQ